jgi:tRNA nucleotidyltransferase/poly(A) polymerase
MIKLNKKEKEIFDLLLRVVKEKNLDCTLRAAGGWVRDKMLGLESHDIDIAIDTMSGLSFAKLCYRWDADDAIGYSGMFQSLTVVKANPDQSKHLETAMIFVLGTPVDFVQFRKEVYDESGRIPGISTGMVSAEEDAKRRDFTINAMFYNLHTGEVEDYCGGMVDLESKTLRTPLDPFQTFMDDPLRILRAIRFAARYMLELDPKLVEAAKLPQVQEAFLTKLAHERIWREMVGIQETDGFKRGFLIGPNPAQACHLMEVLGIRDLLFTLNDQERELLGIKQDETSHWDADQNTPHHNLTIWEHTLTAMSHLQILVWNADLDKNKSVPEIEAAVRNLSILLHDFGKCDLCSRQTKEDGTYGYLGHAETSAKAAEYFLDQKFHAPKDITQRVRNLIFNHMRLHVLEKNPTDSALRRVMKEMGDDWLNLIFHSIADAMGKTGAVEDPKYRSMIERMERLKIEQGGQTKPKRPIDGHVIMTELGLKPGPLIKKVTEALDEQLLENPAMTPEEAVAFIKTVSLV